MGRILTNNKLQYNSCYVQRSGMKRFIIEDDFHANWCGEFGDLADALAKI